MCQLFFYLEEKKMLSIEEMKQRLHDRNLSYIARQIKTSPAWLNQFYHGKLENPSYKTVERLSDYLEKNK